MLIAFLFIAINYNFCTLLYLQDVAQKWGHPILFLTLEEPFFFFFLFSTTHLRSGHFEVSPKATFVPRASKDSKVIFGGLVVGPFGLSFPPAPVDVFIRPPLPSRPDVRL